MRCPGCGGQRFTSYEPLRDELARAWELNEDQALAVGRREGMICQRCRLSVRGMALANGVMRATGRSRLFWQWVLAHPHRSILEVNTAGMLHRYLRPMPRQRLVTYPEVDLQDLPFPNGSWDLVIHSDTLEHVVDPIQALRECRRVLRPRGCLVYTIPIVPGRNSRRCDPDRPSFHGAAGGLQHLVISEYGDDYWREPVEAGFERVETIRFDVTEAIVCRAPKAR